MSRELQPTPEKHGLVSKQTPVLRTEAMPPMWVRALTLGLARPNRKKLEQVLEEERETLRRDLEAKGMLGEHNLVRASLLREPASRSHGSIEGNILRFSGQYDSATEQRSRVLFGWQKPDDSIVVSEIPLTSVQIFVDENTSANTVVFDFEEERLIREGVEIRGTRYHFLDGAVTRFVSVNPNDYINKGLVTATFRAPNEQQLNEFVSLLPKTIKQ